jgi:xeroderma pigmentosum group C-complementing protein
MSWNLSSDEEDDFENWVNERQQGQLAAAATAKGGYDAFSSDDDDDRKPAALNSVAMLLPSEFDALPEADNHNDEESEDNIDWEDAAEDDLPMQPSTGTAATPTVAAKLPAKAVTVELGDLGYKKDDSFTKNDKKRKRRVPKKVFRYENLPPNLKVFLENLQKVHLLGLCGHAMFASRYASNEEVLHVAHSLIPLAWLGSSKESEKDGSVGAAAPGVQDLNHFVGWFGDFSGAKPQSGSFAFAGQSRMHIARSKRGRRANIKNKASKRNSVGVMDVADDTPKTSYNYRTLEYCSDLAAEQARRNTQIRSLLHAYNEYDAILLFLAMTRSMGWRSRYVMAMESIPRDLDVNHPVFEAMSNLNIFMGFWNASNKMKKINSKAAANPICLVDLDEEKESTTKRAKIAKNSNNRNPKTPVPIAPVSVDNGSPSKLLCWVEVLCFVPESRSPRNSNPNNAQRKSGRTPCPLHWVHVDPILGLINRPDTMESIFYAYHQQKARSDLNRKRQPIPYAVAVEHLDVPTVPADEPLVRMTDVTRRYAHSMVETLRARGLALDDKKSTGKEVDSSVENWFAGFLRQHSSHMKTSKTLPLTKGVQTTPTSQGKSIEDAIILDDAKEEEDSKPPAFTPDTVAAPNTASPFDHVEIDEEKQLKAHAKMEPLPTSKAAFKKHPTYVLKSGLNSTDILHPDAKTRTCGMFKGEFVFLRSDVETALPARKWLYQGRKVRETELAKPILKVKARKKPVRKNFKALKSYGVGESNDGSEAARNQTIEDASQPLNDGKQHLYASWQTDPWSPVFVGPNDEIPVNEYNNVELELLNPGLVHIDMKGIAKTAKKLSIPYKPCLLGFEGHGGNRTPTISGIVVHSHNEVLLREAHAEMANHLQQQEENDHRRSILRKWHRLMVGVLTKDRLEREYGDHA